MKLLHIQPLSMPREYEKNLALVCVMMSNFNQFKLNVTCIPGLCLYIPVHAQEMK